ncbi:hypothetical protein K353_06683 [Kitasatospora sp. SolWspMP-SS2h]|nr:hypothetical protein K353_06683 [Kitasatospora sp. SolWspMP-SS2h]
MIAKALSKSWQKVNVLDCRSRGSFWPALIAYAELGPRGVRVVEGFRDHHAPGAVVFEPGTHPEAGR